MSNHQGIVDSRFSTPDASAPDWVDVDSALSAAEIYWITTVRADGCPHVTPLIGAWLDDTFYFCTGEEEQKAVNLRANDHVVISTGNNDYHHGFDLVIEGDAVRATDQALLERIVAVFKAKYDWAFEARDGALFEPLEGAQVALVFGVAPKKILGFSRGEVYSQTRWLFA